MRASDLAKLSIVATFQAFVLFFALSYWWRLSVLLNSAIAPTVPAYAILAFGALWLVGAIKSLKPPTPKPPRTKRENALVAGLMFNGIVGCLLTGAVCFVFSGAPAASLTPPAELSGLAAAAAPLLLAVYIGLVEELAFRGVSSESWRRLLEAGSQ